MKVLEESQLRKFVAIYTPISIQDCKNLAGAGI